MQAFHVHHACLDARLVCLLLKHSLALHSGHPFHLVTLQPSCAVLFRPAVHPPLAGQRPRVTPLATGLGARVLAWSMYETGSPISSNACACSEPKLWQASLRWQPLSCIALVCPLSLSCLDPVSCRAMCTSTFWYVYQGAPAVTTAHRQECVQHKQKYHSN